VGAEAPGDEATDERGRLMQATRERVTARDGFLTTPQRRIILLLNARGLRVWREGPVWAVHHRDHGFVDADRDLERLLKPAQSPYASLHLHLGLTKR
jgi:hypothetical protein